MNKTLIEWAKNPDGSQGYTWNPITGCLNHINGLCKGGNFPCYAYKLANGRLRTRYLQNVNIAPNDSPYNQMLDPFYPRFWPERLPVYYQGKPRGVFVCDMSDLFGMGIPEEWTREVLGTIKRSPNGWRFYLLTKQPQNLIKFSPFPDNCWVGVTATNRTQLTLAQHYLSTVEATVKYISFEPLLEQMTKARIRFKGLGARIDWVIIGAQTKPTVYPNPLWVHEIIVACREVGIPYFLKNNLEGCLTKEPPYSYLVTHKLRQEMPV